MTPVHRNDLDESQREALQALEAGLANSHSPYSGLCVGAALVIPGRPAVLGYNYESASYGLTLCAERAAIARAQAEGAIGGVRSLLLVACRRGRETVEPPLTPCGACRQWLFELSERLGRDLPVTTFWRSQDAGLQGSARELLPEAFA